MSAECGVIDVNDCVSPRSNNTCCEIFLLFENYGQKLRGPIHCWSSNLKVGDLSPPVPTVVAPMKTPVFMEVTHMLRSLTAQLHVILLTVEYSQRDCSEHAVAVSVDWSPAFEHGWLRTA